MREIASFGRFSSPFAATAAVFPGRTTAGPSCTITSLRVSLTETSVPSSVPNASSPGYEIAYRPVAATPNVIDCVATTLRRVARGMDRDLHRSRHRSARGGQGADRTDPIGRHDRRAGLGLLEHRGRARGRPATAAGAPAPAAAAPVTPARSRARPPTRRRPRRRRSSVASRPASASRTGERWRAAPRVTEMGTGCAQFRSVIAPTPVARLAGSVTFAGSARRVRE